MGLGDKRSWLLLSPFSVGGFMSGYITKTEATKILEQSMYYLEKYIASGEISTVQDPKDQKKKLVLASDVCKVKAEKTEQAPQLPEDIAIKELKLDILDAVDAYNVSVSALSLYDEEIKALAEIPTEERKEAFMELVHRIIEKHRGSGGTRDE